VSSDLRELAATLKTRKEIITVEDGKIDPKELSLEKIISNNCETNRSDFNV
jgi:hypothetical protein